MTPSSKAPLAKVTYAAIAAALSAIVLALLRHYLPAFPVDLAGPVDTLVTALFVGAASGFVGYMTPIQPGEIVPKDVR